MKPLLLALTIIGFSIPFNASAVYVYEVTTKTVACPGSMSAMRFLKTGRVKPNIGCFLFVAGDRIISEETVQPKLNPKQVLRLNNNREARVYFSGFFSGRDLVYIGEQQTNK
jgi:hypothetical protein